MVEIRIELTANKYHRHTAKRIQKTLEKQRKANMLYTNNFDMYIRSA